MDVLSQLLFIPQTHGQAGDLFEPLVHHLLRNPQQGITTLTLHLLTSHAGILGESLSVDVEGVPEKKIAMSYYYSLDVRMEKGSHDVAKDFLHLYLVPIWKNNASFDALYITKEATFLFQMTVTKNHPISYHGLSNLYDSLPAKARKFIFVFIIPEQGLDGSAPYKGIESIQSIDYSKVNEKDMNNARMAKDYRNKQTTFNNMMQYVCRVPVKNWWFPG